MHKILKQINWIVAEFIFKALTGLIIGFAIIKQLGPEKYGIYAYVISAITIIQVVTRFGMEGVITKYIVENENQKKELMTTAIMMRFAISIIVILIINIYVSLNIVNLEEKRVISLASLLLMISIFDVVEQYYQALERNEITIKAKLIVGMIGASMRIFGVLEDWEPFGYIAILVTENILLAMAYILLLKKEELIDVDQIKFTLCIDLIKKSFPMMVASLIGVLYLRVDQLILHKLGTNIEMGNYAAAVKVSEVFFIIPTIIITLGYPRLIAKRNNEEEYEKLLQKLLRIGTACATTILVLSIIFSEMILKIIVGEQYGSILTPLNILLFGNIFVYMGVIGSRWYLIEEIYWRVVIRGVVAIITNISMNILLYPKFGIIGMAAASVVTYAVSGLLFDAIEKRTRKLFNMKIKSIIL